MSATVTLDNPNDVPVLRLSGEFVTVMVSAPLAYCNIWLTRAVMDALAQNRDAIMAKLDELDAAPRKEIKS